MDCMRLSVMKASVNTSRFTLGLVLSRVFHRMMDLYCFLISDCSSGVYHPVSQQDRNYKPRL